MARWTLVAVGVAGLLLLGGLHLFWPSARAGADAPAAAGLSGKPVVVLGKDQIAYTLEKAEVRQLGGRAFLVGREMKDPPLQITKERFAGCLIWVPVDSVTEIIELDQAKRGR
jgi:hypothetical protein